MKVPSSMIKCEPYEFVFYGNNWEIPLKTKTLKCKSQRVLRNLFKINKLISIKILIGE